MSRPSYDQDMSTFNEGVIDEFRANGGKVGGPFAGAPMVLLTTTGAKSGIERTTPLVCREGDDGTIYVFASKAGADTHPSWFHNLVAHPQVIVEHGTERFAATATPVEGAERDAIYAAHAAERPQFAEYEAKTTRVIPVVALQRA
jgi:deazaflavin-dependent oxidoreductase (nitroreductase family)